MWNIKGLLILQQDKNSFNWIKSIVNFWSKYQNDAIQQLKSLKAKNVSLPVISN